MKNTNANTSRNKRIKKAGLPPGTLVYTGEKAPTPPKITIIDYDTNHFDEKEVSRVEDCFPYKETPSVTWINVDGVSDVKVVADLGMRFGIHPLVLEDILNTAQRPKRQSFGDYMYVVLKMLSISEDVRVRSEQVSIVFGKNFLITFQEEPAYDVFEPVRKRLREHVGNIREFGTDYLAYSLMDVVVDNYFVVLERLGDEVEVLESKVTETPSQPLLKDIFRLKREILSLRRSVWPLREVVNSFERDESSLVSKQTLLYLRDLYEHTVEVIEIVEMYRDMVSGTIDLYLSAVNNRINSVMKILAVVTTIFMPITFIAGVYGMNFKYMPELEWQLGYPAVLTIMALVVIVMLRRFQKKGWLS